MPLAALHGVRVVDLSRWLPGPYASLLLTDLGAEVIKVEQPGQGDPMRHVLRSSGEGNPLFELTNRGKKSITLELKSDAGRAVFLELVERADVLLEAFRPGVMGRLGLDYDTLAAMNPRLIFASISGYGQMGPYAQRSGHDVDYLATAGFLGLIGTPSRSSGAGPLEGAPSLPSLPIADLSGALWTALAVVAALLQRSTTGRGQYLDLSLLDSVTALMALPLAEWWARGQLPDRSAALLTGGQACYQVYETADGGCMALGALEPHFWATFCQAMGRQDWVPRQFEPVQQGLIAEVAAAFRGEPREHWVRLFSEHDCCCEPVLALDEAFAHPQVEHRGLLRGHYLATPLRSLDVPSAPAPTLGQHTAEILAELGYTEEQIQALRKDGTI